MTGAVLLSPARRQGFSVLRFLLDLGLLGLTAVSVATLFAAEAWLPDVVTFFRPHLFYASLALLLWALAARRRWRGLLAAALVVFNVWPLVAADVPLPALAPQGARTLRVMSANVLFSNPRVDLLRQELEEVSPDIVAVQEESPAWRAGLSDLAGLPYRASDQLPPTELGDVDILSRFPMTVSRVGRVPPLEPHRVGGSIAVRAEVDPGAHGPPFVLYAIHPPTPRTLLGWQERALYLEEIARLIRAEPEGMPVLVAGDWNTPPWSPLFRRFLAAAAMAPADAVPWPAATRVFQAFGIDLPHGLGSPIDRVSVSPQIAVSGFHVGRGFGSDHLPVFADVAVR